MGRHRPVTRLNDLVDHATRVFLTKGYRQTQMSDVARSLGVAPGTVYLYVDSKEALFELVMRQAAGSPMPAELPIHQTSEAALLDFFAQTLDREMHFPVLESAPQLVASSRALSEFNAVVRELFRKTASMWLALKLLEKAAADWPELAALWFGKHRPRVFLLLAEYLSRRMQAGAVRDSPDPAAVARLILEIIAAMGMHCRVEYSPGQYNAEQMEELVVDALMHAYAVFPTHKKSRGSK